MQVSPLGLPPLPLSGKQVCPIHAMDPVRAPLEADDRRLATLGIAGLVRPDISPRDGKLLDERVRAIEVLLQVPDEDVGIGGLEIGPSPHRPGIPAFEVRPDIIGDASEISAYWFIPLDTRVRVC